jgi:hypothetical protein
VALEMRNRCDRCEVALAATSPARICSYECTFCEPCSATLDDMCPDCGGELVPRPRRTEPALG